MNSSRSLYVPAIALDILFDPQQLKKEESVVPKSFTGEKMEALGRVAAWDLKVSLRLQCPNYVLPKVLCHWFCT